MFVSYKYADSSVQQNTNYRYETTVRDYVDAISDLLSRTVNFYYRGENDGEDLSNLDYKTIERKLADKMFNTSVTIVVISPKMFENTKEIEQWIPWEISYSLKNKTRVNGISYMNAILAVVLPDRCGNYDYAMYTYGRNTYVKKKAFFEIMLVNMFNRNYTQHYADLWGNPLYVPGNSYIALTKWSDFYCYPEYYINQAIKNRENWGQFNIVKTIDSRWIS